MHACASFHTIQADSPDWPSGSDPVCSSHSSCSVNLRPLGQITSGQRSFIMCQELYEWVEELITASNTSLFVLEPSAVRVFPGPLGNYFQMLTDIKKFAALLELIYWCWLIIQSSCSKEFYSSIWQAVEFFSWGGAMFFFTDKWADWQTWRAREDLWFNSHSHSFMTVTDTPLCVIVFQSINYKTNCGCLTPPI